MMRATHATCCQLVKKIVKRGYSTTKPPLSLEGVYAPIITPFEKGGKTLSIKNLRENVAKFSNTNLDGLVVLGSNGEFPLLTYQEKLQVLEAVSKENKEQGKKKRLLAGTGAVSTQETIELTRAAAEFGYDAAMVVTPYYYTSRITSAVLRDHFTAVADNSPIPIVLYNVPPFAGVTIPVDLIAELSKHKNIIGVKDTTGSISQISETVRRTSSDFVVIAGSGGYFLHSIMAGAKGAVAALANIFPNEVARIWELCKNEEKMKEGIVEAKKIQDGLTPVNDVASNKFGIGGLKYAVELVGFKGGDPRAPMPQINEAQKKEIEEVLKKFEKTRELLTK